MAYPRSSYEAIPYRGVVLPITSPNQLALSAFWCQGPHPPYHCFHGVELGCGDCANLIPLAFYHPESVFTGIDSSLTELDRASECAKFLGLENINFVLKDVCDLEAEDFALCDYVIAHGLYSWVSEDARDAILKICFHWLKPSGLAYISFNAQPGWATRRAVREILLRSGVVLEATVPHKAERAIAVATQLLEDLPSRDYAFSALLAAELERVQDGKPGYVFHEYLSEVNDGFWLRDFVARAQQHGLGYVADAQACRLEGHVPPTLRSNLAKRDLDPIEQEEMADILCCRYFRASILCRSDAPRQSMTRREILLKAHIATSLCAEPDPLDLTEGVVETFSREHGPEITLDASITKASIILLAEQWPQGMRFESLWQRASKFLISHRCPVDEKAREQLIEELILLYESGQLDLRLEEPNYRRDVPDYPRAHALAQYEAEHQDALTTPYHLPLPFEPEGLSLVRALDGSRSKSELQQVFGVELVEQTLPVIARWGLLAQ